jgi:glycosyltransferase involved in cell wall biosynthesis
MNILQLISSAGNYGAENVVVTLARELQAQGHNVLVGVFENMHTPNLDVAQRAEQLGVPVKIIRCAGRFDWSAVRQIEQAIREGGFELVHSHGYKSNLYAYLAARRAHVATVSSCHGWFDERFPTNLYGMLDRFMLRKFSAVVAISEPIAKQLRAKGVAAEKISIIENGIDFSPFQSAAPSLRTASGLAANILIGLVGRLAEQKGHMFLLQAAPEIFKAYPDARIVFLGTGPLEQALHEEAKTLGVAERVVFAGHVKDMPGVYASLDVLAMPSLDEGLPIALLEAMASARAIVVTAVGEIPSVVRDRQNALVVQPRDVAALRAAILRLLGDAALAQTLGRAARETVQQRFSSQKMTSEYVAMYQNVLGKKAAKSGQ